MKQRKVLPCTGGGGSSLTATSNVTDSQPTKLRGPVDPGFTMAEILLSLTIIGVVAAITLPSLTGNINERTWNTQRKALYARFSQAIALMPALNGYGTLSGTIDASGSQTITEDNVAETFITSGLSKVMKINNICESGHLNDCGLTAGFTDISGGSHDLPVDMQELNSKMLNYRDGFASDAASHAVLNTKAAAFETANGESIALYYNPNCVASMNEIHEYSVQPKICVNMIYDLNGSKGPNTIGKDMGTITILYPSDSVVVAPEPYRNLIENVSAENASRACTAISSGNEYRLGTREELAAFFINKYVWGLGDTAEGADLVMSNSKIITQYWNTLWGMNLSYGIYQIPLRTDSWKGVCVKR